MCTSALYAARSIVIFPRKDRLYLYLHERLSYNVNRPCRFTLRHGDDNFASPVKPDAHSGGGLQHTAPTKVTAAPGDRPALPLHQEQRTVPYEL
jgi:hypothetical protein